MSSIYYISHKTQNIHKEMHQLPFLYLFDLLLYQLIISTLIQISLTIIINI